MSDEEMERAKAALRLLWERVTSAVNAVRRAVRAVTRWFKTVWRFVCRRRQVAARYEWAEARRTARFLSRHPDLAAFDGWLDGWYTDPVMVDLLIAFPGGRGTADMCRRAERAGVRVHSARLTVAKPPGKRVVLS